MNTIAIIISIIALVGAGFAFLRAVSAYNMLTKRINKLKDQNADLESRLRRLEGNASRGNRPASEPGEGGRQKKQRPEQQRQEQQPEQRQRQRERQQPQPQQEEEANANEQAQQPKQKRRRDKRRRDEPTDRTSGSGEELAKEEQRPRTNAVRLEIAGGDLLDELEMAASATPPPVEPEAMPEVAPDTGTRFAIIPEDGVIRQHQLQQHPDSDSYIEMDIPADGSGTTRYRFNLSGNHAFVIAQGIDRLENAFDFEKPSNRMVSRVVLQGDGILVKVNNGWRIQEKARIDFR
ncbi:hypothetical protein [Pontibacter flavimaris]|uniref:Uncharacterized protein n=1 Tax=Pontibacter flavimaris TaxID=1797110 RepID=A0A1Q5PD22_9BACT|nr:hypothetical protein [Pontibacter flavimaris]OKL40107.1 hypothetical protein A3841_17300 [Pontibacter flavimaris]